MSGFRDKVRPATCRSAPGSGAVPDRVRWQGRTPRQASAPETIKNAMSEPGLNPSALLQVPLRWLLTTQMFVDWTCYFVQTYKTRERKANAMTRNPNMREAYPERGPNRCSRRGAPTPCSIRDIALGGGRQSRAASPIISRARTACCSQIYKRHCGPMNKRRIELLVAARRVRDVQDRLEAIVCAYVQPALSSSSDLAEGLARFTRLRAVMSA